MGDLPQYFKFVRWMLTDCDNHRVQVFTRDGNFLRSFGSYGDKQGEFHDPTGIALDKNNNIIVVESNNHRIQLLSEQGEYLRQFGDEGNLDHQLDTPRGLSVDNEGNIVVADRYNKSIKIFSKGGHYLSKLGREGSFTFPFHCVQYDEYLSVRPRRTLYQSV